ncbi:hypothetical protein J2Z62_000028 [Mycoplasmoides fastidiosum]|uniref:Uncharacterized protein n=1 Tax=Mycoplasmoides fastidiosum TaxID=92758 RepID=A0ABU0LY37_9BACT|nr:hypothetical protein [Mycoplasmoides fastidiosum]MDQ0513590.1 hypothetical protein [Mycoplasmoides fastidiosum]UUD37987.1 hypothetical protein NPA10_01155 [Mycoplasmoides fastidiosum]
MPTWLKKCSQLIKIWFVILISFSFFTAIASIFSQTITNQSQLTKKLDEPSAGFKLQRHQDALTTTDEQIQPPTPVAKTLADFDFPEPEFINGGKLGPYNVHNIYDAAGFALLYAKAKTNSDTATAATEPFDHLVLINNRDNSLTWNISATEMIAQIKTTRATPTGARTSADPADITGLRINKAQYSSVANAFFVSVYARTSATSGNTVVLKINRTDGEISVYYDTKTEEAQKLTASNGTNYSTREFNHLVIRTDGLNPNLLMVAGNLNKDNNNNVITAFLISNQRIDTSGMLLATPTNYVAQIQSGAELIVTNSIFSNSALLLVFFVRTSANEAVANSPKIYSFSLNSNVLQSPAETAISSFNDSVKQTFFTVETNSKGLFLNAKSQKENNQNFTSNGKVLVQKLSASININNAAVEISKYEQNVPYLANMNPSSFVPVLNENKLLNGAAYVTVNENHVLVALSENFAYLQQIALLSNIPNGVKILSISNDGRHYLIHLSNGQILAFNNSGFVAYAQNLNNAFEAVSPISFIPQSEIRDGARYTTLKPSDFQNQFRANQTVFLTPRPAYAYTGFAPIYEYEFHETTITDLNLDYSHEMVVNAYQKLRNLDPSTGLPQATATPNSVRYFLGSYKYQLYARDAVLNIAQQIPRNFILRSLPTDVAAFYNRSENYRIAVADFLRLKNVNLNDKYADVNNLSITFNATNRPARFLVTVNIGYVWTNGTRQNPRRFQFAFNGFNGTTRILEELNYTLNPKIGDQLDPNFSRIFPSQLKDSDVIDQFISLSDELQKYSYTINLVPDNTKGTAIITISFDFGGDNVALSTHGIDPKVTLVTPNSVTWETPSVFKADSNYNQTFLFGFNTFDDISKKRITNNDTEQSVSLLQPSNIANQFKEENQTTEKNLTDKIKVATDVLGLITASTVVRNLISQVTITDINDLLGSFTLKISLINPLPGSLVREFSHSFTGFARRNPNVSDAFTVGFVEDREAYLRQFSPADDQNLFNLLPSNIVAEDLVQRGIAQLSAENKVLGGLINLSQPAAEANPVISLNADNARGNLLVSLFFETFLEYNQLSGQFQLIRNRKISKVYTGFKTGEQIDNNTGYFINWKASNDVVLGRDLSTLNTTAGQFYAELRKLSNDYELAKIFADLSPAAQRKYGSNPDLVQATLDVSNSRGTITITLNFDQWNEGNGVTTFVQEFSGFLIPEDAWQNAVETFDPFNGLDPNDDSFIQAKSVTRADQASGTVLANFYSFANSVFNNLEKEVYFLFNANDGSGQIHFFVKTPQLAPRATNTPTPPANNNPAPQPQNPAPETNPEPDDTRNPTDPDPNATPAPTPDPSATNVTQAHYVRFADEDEVNTDTADSATDNVKTFNTQVIPYRSLRDRGFIELTHSGQTLTGFQRVQLYPNFTNSIIYILLAIFLPIIIFGPALFIFHTFRGKHMIAYYQNKLRKILEREFSSSSEYKEKLPEIKN